MATTQITEMPISVGDLGNLFGEVKKIIDDAIDKNIQPQKIGYNVYKITDGKVSVYYFLENNINVGGVVINNVRPGLYQVDIAGKNPYYKNRPPYVSNLYPFIINELSPNDSLLSGSQLSRNGLRLWKRLVKLYPGKVGVYDVVEKTISPIENPEQLNNFISQNSFDRNSSKNLFMIRGQGISNTERIKELAGIKRK